MIQSIRYLFLSVTLLFLSCNQNNSKDVAANNDSINKYLKLASNDSLSFVERDKFNEKAFSLIDLSKNDTLVRWYLCQIALNFSVIKNNKDYFRTSNIHFVRSKTAKDTLNLARFYRYRAGYHLNNTRLFDSVFYFYVKSEKMYLTTDKEYELACLYFHKGRLQNQFDDYLGANFTINQSYSIIKKGVVRNITYDVLNLLGNISHNLKDYHNAIDYHDKALKIAIDFKLKSKINRFNYISTSLNNIGNSYKELKEYKKAIYYFKLGLKEKNLIENDPEVYAYLLNNLGFCMLKINEYKQLPDLFVISERLFNNLGIKNECAVSNIYLSDYYYKQQDTLKAIGYSEKALRLASEAKAPYYYLTALSNAGYVNKKKASKYIKQYHEINDSLQFEQRKVRNQFYKIQLETDEIVQEKEAAIKQKWIIASIISSVLLIVILLFVIYRQRAKQKELKLLQIQQKANEEIYQLMLNQQAKVEEARQIEKKQIALELHDGIMNRLASTRLNLFILKKKNDQETINNCLTYIEDIHNIENEIRNVSHNLNHEVYIEKDSFKILLQQFIKEQNNHSKTNFELQIDENVNWDLITTETKMHLYRIFQEGISNINKHANAATVIISFTMNEEHMKILVTDNGVGFDTKKTKDGIGLKNILQRIESLNGTFTIESKKNKGTALYLSIPIK